MIKGNEDRLWAAFALLLAPIFLSVLVSSLACWSIPEIQASSLELACTLLSKPFSRMAKFPTSHSSQSNWICVVQKPRSPFWLLVGRGGGERYSVYLPTPLTPQPLAFLVPAQRSVTGPGDPAVVGRGENICGWGKTFLYGEKGLKVWDCSFWGVHEFGVRRNRDGKG